MRQHAVGGVNVVEPSQCVLKLFQRLECRAAMLSGSGAGLQLIAQMFAALAQRMQCMRIGVDIRGDIGIEYVKALAEAPQALPQQACAARRPEAAAGVAAQRPGVQGQAAVQQPVGERRRQQVGAGSRQRGLLLGRQRRAQRTPGASVAPCLRACLRRRQFLHQYMGHARRCQCAHVGARAGDHFLAAPALAQHGLEQFEQGAQAAQTDADLMQVLVVEVGTVSRQVQADVVEAILGERRESRGGACIGRCRRRQCAVGLRPGKQQAAARGFGQWRRKQRDQIAELRDQIEQPFRRTLDQFQFELTNRFLLAAGADRAAVEGDLDAGVRGRAPVPDTALEVGIEDRPVAGLLRQRFETLAHRRVVDAAEIEGAAIRAFPLRTSAQAAADLARALDGLQQALALAPDAQGDTLRAQGLLRRVVIGVLQLQPLRLAPRQLPQLATQARRSGGRAAQFEFDFHTGRDLLMPAL